MPPVGLAGANNIIVHPVHEGILDEVIYKDQFSYVRMAGKWFALVGGPFKKGQKVQIEEQAVIDQFRSKTLDRTFDKIIFGTLKEN